MTSKKLGALLRSVPPATAPTEVHDPAIAIAPSAPKAEPIRAASDKLPIETEVPLQVLIPRHVRTQLAVKAAQEGQSLRAKVLRSLRGLGIEVTDEEIRDKRGRRHMNS